MLDLVNSLRLSQKTRPRPNSTVICKRTVLTKFGRSKSKAVAKYGMVRLFPGLCKNVVINRYRDI